MHSAWIKDFFQSLKRYWTIRARLTILYLLIFGSTLIVFCSILFRNFITNQQNAFDVAVFNHAVDIAQGITVGPFGNLIINPDVLSMGGRIFPFPAGTVYIQILALDGSEIGRSRNLGKSKLPISKNDLKLLKENRAIFQTISAKDLKLSGKPKQQSALRLLTALSPGQTNQDFILQVAVPEEFLDQSTKGLKRFLWISIPLTLLSAAIAGLYLSRRALIPVSDMIDRANRLSPHHLSERIPVPLADDEIKYLALTLNALLSRLQRAFESQERFIADASHELKTPLAILRGELDVFRSRPRGAEEVSSLIENSLTEIDHLSRMVEDLLILARVDAGSAVIVKETVRLEEVVLDVISKLEVLGRQKNIKIRFNLSQAQPEMSATAGSNDEIFSVRADSDLLRVLIKNLIENAIKYSPTNDVVEVTLLVQTDFVQLDVTDHGPGIPNHIVSKIFERFFRGPLPTESPSQGAGLGLAIVQKIAEIHGGKIDVKSLPNEATTFSVQIKKF